MSERFKAINDDQPWIDISSYKNKVFIIGIRLVGPNEETLELTQIKATLVDLEEDSLVFRKDDGELLHLPPDMGNTRPAAPGKYVLKSTGEVVVDPDFITLWCVKQRQHCANDEPPDPNAWYM